MITGGPANNDVITTKQRKNGFTKASPWPAKALDRTLSTRVSSPIVSVVALSA